MPLTTVESVHAFVVAVPITVPKVPNVVERKTLYDVAPLTAIQAIATELLLAVVVTQVGADGAATCGVADTSLDAPLSPIVFTEVTMK